MADHNELGVEGENIAVKHLISQGHEIIYRNFRFRKAEVDIISKTEKTLVFTEVKSRSSNRFGYPETFVTKAKQRLLHSAANHYLQINSIDEEIRFDIISITFINAKPHIHHIEDAFYMV